MKRLLLTGATGTIGSALVPRLLADPAARLSLLVRAASPDELRRRTEGMLAWWGWRAGDAMASRIEVLRGDISQPQFGLDGSTLARLASQTTHIVHCAASVNLLMPMAQALATAVTPTRTVLDIGRRCAGHGVLQKIEIVSTVGVWGRAPGVMPEAPVPEVDDFHNTYEAAKAQAERVVWTEGAGLPITVHRPSMVVGESATGRVIHFQVFYHLCEFLSGARTYGVMPDLGTTRLDTVPVDWVADVIAWSAGQPANAGRILHLCSGVDGAVPLPALQQRVRRLWAERGRRLPPLRRVSRRLLERLVPVIGAVAGTKARRSLRALPPVLAYLAESQAFANDETARLAAAAGLPVPAAEAYLDHVLGHYLDAKGWPARSAPT